MVCNASCCAVDRHGCSCACDMCSKAGGENTHPGSGSDPGEGPSGRTPAVRLPPSCLPPLPGVAAYGMSTGEGETGASKAPGLADSGRQAAGLPRERALAAVPPLLDAAMVTVCPTPPDWRGGLALLVGVKKRDGPRNNANASLPTVDWATAPGVYTQ